ncbi:uncharacterized protein EV420DRAFT_1558065 [Desarmillaria tabescens]|uniref:F-box domain-containing protein n=1 Tax=Armillaria tabescens TaxID=1929756 RepID=A0AA39N030_ARMTA|nr:uncharacterized protein EV420DRAFT_1558065 [Desarmillaria tabescens]KAK0453017.1 hypothetical protein EV420DRAFT_1558065 [Desarmillaria tabescens]
MSSNSVVTKLPPEIIEQIIFSLWSLDLTTTERVHLITSSVLVNHAWAELFLRVSWRDVFIPTLPFVMHFRRLLCGEATSIIRILNLDPSLPNVLCRSITFDTSKQGLKDPMVEARGNLGLFFLGHRGIVPDLRWITYGDGTDVRRVAFRWAVSPDTRGQCRAEMGK